MADTDYLRCIVYARSGSDLFRIPSVGGILTIFARFKVEGVPIPKGSTKAFVINGRAATTNANPRTKDWQQRISMQAQTCRGDSYIPKTNRGDDGVGIIAKFMFPRPKVDKKGRRLMTVKPDLDKLMRTIGDALTGIIYDDDSQIVSICASKDYVDDGPPYVEITIHYIQKLQPL
ncbi:MAG: RusA family crossover junction endodeoxyribonuclease [Spirochaetia bacterium]|nr:RusA family crossover junction endodeoxyribonuclease [Spirochaetia bacterium]